MSAAATDIIIPKPRENQRWLLKELNNHPGIATDDLQHEMRRYNISPKVFQKLLGDTRQHGWIEERDNGWFLTVGGRQVYQSTPTAHNQQLNQLKPPARSEGNHPRLQAVESSTPEVPTRSTADFAPEVASDTQFKLLGWLLGNPNHTRTQFTKLLADQHGKSPQWSGCALAKSMSFGWVVVDDGVLVVTDKGRVAYERKDEQDRYNPVSSEPASNAEMGFKLDHLLKVGPERVADDLRDAVGVLEHDPSSGAFAELLRAAEKYCRYCARLGVA
ncbi:MAG: hypothetical protein R3F02_18575 [Thiolinea sp.]